MKIKNKDKGFTLIELLVVIAIIALLASVILVAVGNSRTKSRNAKRLSDITQLASAFSLYLNTCNSYPQTGPVAINSAYGLFSGTAAQCGNNSGSGTNGGLGPVPATPGTVFAQQLQTAPLPADDGALAVGSRCTEANGSFTWNSYVYTSTVNDRYTINFCISEPVGSTSGGRHNLTETGVR